MSWLLTPMPHMKAITTMTTSTPTTISPVFMSARCLPRLEVVGTAERVERCRGARGAHRGYARPSRIYYTREVTGGATSAGAGRRSRAGDRGGEVRGRGRGGGAVAAARRAHEDAIAAHQH